MPRLYSDMPAGTRNQYVAWVQSHDWGQAAHYCAEDGRIRGLLDDNEDGIRGEVGFACHDALRAWAGY